MAGIFVGADGRVELYPPTFSTQDVRTSLDGDSWVTHTQKLAANLATHMLLPAHGGVYAVGYQSGSNSTSVYHTTDGITWALRGTINNFSHTLSIAVDPATGILAVAGDRYTGASPNGSAVYTSSDRGATWALSLTFPAIQAAVSYVNGRFLATAASDVYTSADGGFSWQAAGSTLVGQTRFAYSPAAGVATNGHYWSDDFVTWTACTGRPGTMSRSGPIWVPSWGKFVGVASSYVNIGIYTSYWTESVDGKSWNTRFTGSGQFRSDGAGAAYSPDLDIVILGYGAQAAGPTGPLLFSNPRMDTKAVAWLSLNSEPYAPDGLTPDVATINLGVPQRFSWQFHDPDDGDSQSEYELRCREQGDLSWTTVSDETPYEYHDFLASTFTVGDWEWQVRTADQAGEWSPWSATAFFTTANPPPTPTITAPVNNATVTQPSVLVGWSTAGQDAFQVRTVTDDGGSPDPSVVLWDSGTLTMPSPREWQTPLPDNLTWQHIQIRIRRDGLWSTWAAVRVYTNFTLPGTPTVTVTADMPAGAIRVTVVNPAPEPGEPTPVAVDIHRRTTGETGRGIRRATQLAPSPTFTDWAVASGAEYEYQATVTGDNGATASSTWEG